MPPKTFHAFIYFGILTTNLTTLLFVPSRFSFLLWLSSASIINLNRLNNLYLYDLTFCIENTLTLVTFPSPPPVPSQIFSASLSPPDSFPQKPS